MVHPYLSRRYLRSTIVIGLSLVWLSASVEIARGEDDPVLRGKKASEWAKQLLEDPKPNRRQIALIALEALAPQTKRAMEATIQASRSEKDAEVRKAIVQALAKMDTMSQVAMQALADVLREDADAGVREAAATGIGRLDPTAARAAVGVLVNALKDANPAVRAATAEAVGRLGADGGPAVENLTALLKDADPGTRLYACYAIGRIGSASRPAVPELGRVLKADSDAQVRKEAAKALGQLGPDAGEGVADLGAVLVDDKAPLEVRQQAANALSRVGGGALKPISPQLAKALKDRDRTIRVAVLAALDTMGKEAADLVKEIVACLQLDGNAEIRATAIGLLGKLGPDAKEALPALRLAEKDNSPAVRAAAREAIDKIMPAS